MEAGSRERDRGRPPDQRDCHRCPNSLTTPGGAPRGRLGPRRTAAPRISSGVSGPLQ
ncbi:hypothetical protein [Ornithinimicrobium kibberense]|uniref:hypothetical protein n=1 Tax=Ornithinimicrobium kibberense TaxID=282060 RepID=UPI00361C4AF0